MKKKDQEHTKKRFHVKDKYLTVTKKTETNEGKEDNTLSSSFFMFNDIDPGTM